MTAPALRFQQAKNPLPEPNFLQIVAEPPQSGGVASKPAPAAKSEPKLVRVAFRVSRLMEFCSERELINQTGHSAWDWPLVTVKELIDNSLDACEEAEVAPEIAVALEKDTIVVQDNAGGLDGETIESVLDYSIRVSSREAYVSPTRGAQGNALKTILAMGYVLGKYSDGPAVCVTVIESLGVKHRIEFRVDHIDHQPKIVRRASASPVMVGTKITVKWPPTRAPLFGHAADRLPQLVRGYVWFNPHLTLRGTWFGKEFVNVAATNPHWRNGARAIQPARIGMTRRGCNGTSPRMSAGTATLASAARCASSSPSSAPSRRPRFNVKSSTRSAARTSRWRPSSARSRSTAPASPSCLRR